MRYRFEEDTLSMGPSEQIVGPDDTFPTEHYIRMSELLHRCEPFPDDFPKPVFVLKRTRRRDCLFNHSGGLILSARLIDILRRNGANFQQVAIDILDGKTGSPIEHDYSLCNILERADAINVKRSRNKLGSVEIVLLREFVAHGAPLVRDAVWTEMIFVSEAIAQEMTQTGITGVELTELS